MVSIRCQMVVKYYLEKLSLEYIYVKIGEAEISGEVQPEKLEQLKNDLKEVGLFVIDNKRSILIERIKLIILDLVHYSKDQIPVNLSDYLSEKLNFNYTYLANIFSEEIGTTIEKFYITNKIERVKELILYDDLNLTEIAWKMHYSSVSHLSNQFKKYTGLTPTQFRMLKPKHQGTLQNVEK